jgi:hypothetical protein
MASWLKVENLFPKELTIEAAGKRENLAGSATLLRWKSFDTNPVADSQINCLINEVAINFDAELAPFQKSVESNSHTTCVRGWC